MTAEEREALAYRIVHTVIGTPRIKPHPSLVAKVSRLLKDAHPSPSEALPSHEEKEVR